VKVRRDIASIPRRSAKETWDAVVDLITGPGSVDSATLTEAASIMQSLIADEHPRKVPIVVKGAGNRLVIYLVVGEEAMDADMSVDELNWNPTKGNWSITAPADADDVDWMNKTLKTRAPRISVHDVNTVPSGDDEDISSETAGISINWGALE
jgi:hypothetical protein